MFTLLKQHLPGFSESNWTSCLRHYAGFPPCPEGLSDFIYEGDMGALKTLFQLDTMEEWKTAYIEVKSTIRSEKFSFHLSNNQFEMVYCYEDLSLKNSTGLMSCT